jgi:hypothetical protein
MASTKQRPRAAGGPNQSRLLQLLRRHGYAEELPPSTVSWLETRPVFRWLADNLGDDNFVSAEAQQLYEAIQLDQAAAGGGGAPGGSKAAARLMSAMGIGSDDSSGADSDGDGGGGGAAAARDGGWGADPESIEELEAAIQVRRGGGHARPRVHTQRRGLQHQQPAPTPTTCFSSPFSCARAPLQEQQAHRELLQQQLASIGATTRRLAAAAAPGPAKQRRAAVGALRAKQLRQAAAGAAEAGQELDAQLGALADAVAAWADLADSGASGDDWLVCTADASGYAAQDAEMQEIISRWGRGGVRAGCRGPSSRPRLASVRAGRGRSRSPTRAGRPAPLAGACSS